MQYLLSISGLINGIIALIFGFIVLAKNRKNIINQTGFLLTLATAVWAFGYWRWLAVYDNEPQALFWIIVLSIGSLFIPIFYFHWIVSLLDMNKKYWHITVPAYMIGLIYLPITTSHSFISYIAPIATFAYWPRGGTMHLLYLIFIYLGLVFYGMGLLIKHYKTASDLKKQQIKFILIGSVIGFGGGATNFFYWYDIRISPLPSILVGAYPIIFAYSIVKFQLMDIRLVARKYLVYAAYAATIALIFLFFKLITYTFVSTTFAQIIDLILLIAAVLFTNPLKHYYYKIANQHFFSSLYDTEDVIEEISNKLHSTIDLQTICDNIYTTLKKNFHLQSMGILRLRNRTSNFRPLYAHNLELPKGILLNNTFLYDHFLSYNITVTTAQLKELNEKRLYPIIEVLEELNIAVLVPLIIKNDVIGVLALGKKESKDVYNEEDLRVLKIIAAQGATAIENARLYAEVQSFGATLQKKVDEQTREIKAKAEHLKKLMDMRSEFLDITSHQLRTPVSVIKGVLSMLEEGSIPEDRKQAFIKGAMEKSIKLGEIINDILRASEMDSDKFTMTIREVDLNDMMSKINDDKIRSAEMKKLKFFMEIPTLPPVMTDPKYVEHAIVNLINNSIQYTVEGSITVTAEVNPTHVIIRVSDTGIGIPPEAREKLFTKFARAANAVTTFTDGTGLGLFIIKQIVDANPGAKIEIERTEINIGTTFAYWLPRADIK